MLNASQDRLTWGYSGSVSDIVLHFQFTWELHVSRKLSLGIHCFGSSGSSWKTPYPRD